MRAGGSGPLSPEACAGDAQARKHEGKVVSQPDFAILIRRVRDRVATLMSLYAGGELELDFKLFGQTAAEVRTVRADRTVGFMSRCDL